METWFVSSACYPKCFNPFLKYTLIQLIYKFYMNNYIILIKENAIVSEYINATKSLAMFMCGASSELVMAYVLTKKLVYFLPKG